MTIPRIKWWRLSEDQCFVAFRGEARNALSKVGKVFSWQDIANTIKKIGRNVCGVSSGKRKCDKESWWWNPECEREKNSKKELGHVER